MKNKNLRFLFQATMATTCLVDVAVQGGTIVPDLDDGSAVFSSTAPVTSSTLPSALTLANGLTLAASFTPNATDIANSANGPVGVLEIGGSSNGSGFWLINGDLWFLTKGTSQGTAVPSSNLDMDGVDGVIGIQLDALTAGVQLDVYASLDTVNDSLLISQNSITTSYTLTGVTSSWNWQGNRSVSFGNVDPTVTVNGATHQQAQGYDGALADLAAGSSPFSDNSAVALDGTVELGQIFNAVSIQPAPEPGTLALAGLGVAGLLLARRRKV
jgi:hypothetical protein